MITKKCHQCNIKFNIEQKEVTRQEKNGRNIFFCSKNCAAISNNSKRKETNLNKHLKNFSIKDFDLGWLVGILEGEGSFNSPSPSDPTRMSIKITSTDLDVIERVANLFQINYIHKRIMNNPKWKDNYSIRIIGTKAQAFSIKLYPYMSNRRKESIKKALKLSNCDISLD